MALKRDPINIRDLEDREALISFIDDPKIGKLGTFPDYWHTAGIETNDGSWGRTRELVESTTAGAGYGVVSRHYKAGNISSTIDLLEDNEVTRYIKWPSTHIVGGVHLRLHDNKVAQGKVARVHRYNDGVVEIEVSREPAFLTMPESSRGDAAAGSTLNVGYQTDADKVAFESTYFRVTEEAVVALEPKVFVDEAELQAKIDAGEVYQIGGTGGEVLNLEVVDPAADQAAAAPVTP